MNDKLERWIKLLEAVRPEMDRLAKRLEQRSVAVEPANTRAVGELPYCARFRFDDGAVTTIKFLLKDRQTSSDVVVTNMTTLPEEQCGRGFGSRAIKVLLQWAVDNSLNEVRATQVGSQQNELFWLENGFERGQQPNPCNDFVYVIAACL